MRWLSELAYLTNATLVLFTIQSCGALRTHTKYDLTLWRGDRRHGPGTSFTSAISQRALRSPAPYGTESLWTSPGKGSSECQVWGLDLKTQGYCMFSFYSQLLFDLSRLQLSPCILFFFPFFHLCATTSPLSPWPSLFFIFSLPHLHSFPSSIPSYTPCPLTLNHRWTKQWAMSHSIKTNNPVMGGGLCGAWATVTRQYARWVQAATNLRRAMIQFTDGHWREPICTHTHTHPSTRKKKKAHNEVVLSGRISSSTHKSKEFILSIAPFCSPFPLPHPSIGGMELIAVIDYL